MIASGKMQELEAVVLTEDLPEYDLKRGEKGVVVETFDKPEEAYMLEFVDESGASSKIADWVKPGQMKPVKQAAKEFFDQVFELLKKGDSVGAERAFREAVALYPKDISNIGESFRGSFANAKDARDWLTAVRLYEMCFRLTPTHEIIRHNLAVAYHNYGNRLMEVGKTEEALQAFHQAVLASSDPDIGEGVKRSMAATFTNLGIQASKQEDFRNALANFKWAFSAYSDEVTKSNLAKAYFNLAEACLSENSLEDAVGFFKEALLAGYVEPSLYNDYAIAFVRIGRIDDAIFALESGLALAPDNEVIRENLRMANETSLNLQREFIEPQFEPIQTHEYQLAA